MPPQAITSRGESTKPASAAIRLTSTATLTPVPEAFQRLGDDLLDLPGAELLAHGAPHAPEGVRGGEHLCAPSRGSSATVCRRDLLVVRLGEPGGVGHHHHLQPGERLHRPQPGGAARGGNDDLLDAELLSPRARTSSNTCCVLPLPRCSK